MTKKNKLIEVLGNLSLDIYDQMGVDVLGRLREFNKARNIKGY